MDNTIYGFLSPWGEFHKCEYGDHIPLADDILEKCYHIKGVVNPVDRLCRFGWICIQEAFVGFVNNDIDIVPHVTYEQKFWLQENKDKFSGPQFCSLQRCLDLDKFVFG